MSYHQRFLFTLLLVLLAASCVPVPASAGEDWLPVTPDELKMTSEPKAPGAPAIYLYRQVDRDDAEFRENYYARIKILTEEGRKYADIEIPFLKGQGNIKNIKARTIQPDGSIVNFDGKTYEKTIVKAKGVKFLAKTFTMPNVQPGSIVESRYTRFLPEGWIYDSRWLLSEELFTKRAKFSLNKNGSSPLQCSWPRGLPPGTNPPVIDHNVVRLEAQDIPAFQIEDYMPPVDEMKYRVDFLYTQNTEKDPEKFWKEYGRRAERGVQLFTDKPKVMEQVVAQTVSPSDTPEQKLRKLYERCQKVRNLSFEREKTQQEQNREKLKEIQNVEDIWKRGYGSGYEITWLFLALARAAGFDAVPVEIATRDEHFFDVQIPDPNALNTNAVTVKLDGKEMYFDPGIAFAPFGVLPWYETGVAGLRIEKDGGTWISTPMPDPATVGIDRKADLQLDDEGALEGKLTVTFKGISALWRRIDENDEDATERKKFLEDEVKGYVPVAAEVELTNSPDWSSSTTNLEAEFHLKILGWASSAGRRSLLAAGLFGGGEKHVFEGANRVHPIYFSHPYTDIDDVTISLPAGWRVENTPRPLHLDVKSCSYKLSVENQDRAVHVSRQLMVNITMVDPKYYGALRYFFQVVRTGDEGQIVLSPVTQ